MEQNKEYDDLTNTEKFGVSVVLFWWVWFLMMMRNVGHFPVVMGDFDFVMAPFLCLLGMTIVGLTLARKIELHIAAFSGLGFFALWQLLWGSLFGEWLLLGVLFIFAVVMMAVAMTLFDTKSKRNRKRAR